MRWREPGVLIGRPINMSTLNTIRSLMSGREGRKRLEVSFYHLTPHPLRTDDPMEWKEKRNVVRTLKGGKSGLGGKAPPGGWRSSPLPPLFFLTSPRTSMPSYDTLPPSSETLIIYSNELSWANRSFHGHERGCREYYFRRTRFGRLAISCRRILRNGVLSFLYNKCFLLYLSHYLHLQLRCFQVASRTKYP